MTDKAVAVHEAGHAVAVHRLGGRWHYAVLNPADVDTGASVVNPSRLNQRGMAIALVAGSVAQAMAASPDGLWRVTVLDTLSSAGRADLATLCNIYGCDVPRYVASHTKIQAAVLDAHAVLVDVMADVHRMADYLIEHGRITWPEYLATGWGVSGQIPARIRRLGIRS